MSKLLPPNATKFEIHFESAFSRISDIQITTDTLNNPMTAPLSVLPWLAWEKSVDVWDKNWNETQKRNAVANAFSLHAHKGTIGALEQAIDGLGLNVKIREWWQTVPQGKPYTFEVFIEITQTGISELHYQKLTDIINKNKNLRSHWKYANTFVISEISAEVINLPLCIGQNFTYTIPAGYDIFTDWTAWKTDQDVTVISGTAHYTAYKTNNMHARLNSYAVYDLTAAIVRSLHDTDMQQWQAVKDACNEMTGVTDWFFDVQNQQIKYIEILNLPTSAPISKYYFRHGQTFPSNRYSYGDFDSCRGYYQSISAMRSCLIANVKPIYSIADRNDLTQSLNNARVELDRLPISMETVVSAETFFIAIGSSFYTSFDVRMGKDITKPEDVPATEKNIAFSSIAQKIISNTSAAEPISLMAQVFIETVAKSIFSNDPVKRFVTVSDIEPSLENNIWNFGITDLTAESENGLNVSWKSFGYPEFFNYYRSAQPFSTTNLPALVQKNMTVLSFSDIAADTEKNQYVRIGTVKNGREIISDQYTHTGVKHAPTGFWSLAVACWGSTTAKQYDITDTTQPTWAENFRYTRDFIDYRRVYQPDGPVTAPITVGRNVSIDLSMLLGKTFELVVQAGVYKDNYGRIAIAFQDKQGANIACVMADRSPLGFGSTLKIGKDFSAANIPSEGQYPTANGYLTITATGITYTPKDPTATTKYKAFTFNADMTQLATVNLAGVEAHQPRSSTSVGNPTGSSALVYLKLLQ